MRDVLHTGMGAEGASASGMRRPVPHTRLTALPPLPAGVLPLPDQALTLLRLLPSPVLVTDPAGLCLEVNGRFRAVTGYRTADLAGLPVDAILDAARPAPDWRAVAAGGRAAADCPAALIGADGATMHVRAGIAAVTFESGTRLVWTVDTARGEYPAGREP